MSDLLVAFLRARIAEDERDAQEAVEGEWSPETFPETVPQADLVRSETGIVAEVLGAGVEHIARHDPARVLADVEAKRRIIDHLASQAEKCPEGDWPDSGDMWAAPLADQARLLLRLLALPNAEHPHCHPSWLPRLEA